MGQALAPTDKRSTSAYIAVFKERITSAYNAALPDNAEIDALMAKLESVNPSPPILGRE